MKKSAFSLLELSVSLVVVGLLMAMVSQGIKIIASSRLTTARSLTSKSPVPNISGLIAWHETSSVDSIKANEAINGKQISTWYDISPNSIPAKKNTLTRVASAAVTYKSDGINKIPSISFNGSGRISVSSFYQGKSTQNTIFFVSSPYSLSNAPTPIDSGNSFTATPISYLSNGIRIYAGTVADFATSGCCSTNSSYIVAAYLNRTSSKTYINDAKTMAGGTMRNPGSSVMDGLTIGTDRVGSYPFTGLVSEVIVYNRPLETQERKDVMSYLSKKYGILVTGL
jgi:prepilin-type N-terminal cleavage/methylation domain-containing protein